jgi:hypothetical protein
MEDLYVMRRANGDLFVEQIDGKPFIPVWPGQEAAVRFKARNPELLVFLPARLDRPLIRKIKSGLGTDGASQFFLISGEDPDAYLDEGRPVEFEEIFPVVQSDLQPAQAQV